MCDRPAVVSAAEDERVAAASQLALGLQHELPAAVTCLDREASRGDFVASGKLGTSIAFGDWQRALTEQLAG